MTVPVPSPYATTIQTVRNGICAWFGGDYDDTTRTYRTPQVPSLGAVRRSRSKRTPDSDYYLGNPSSGAIMGSIMYTHLDSGVESRQAIAGPFNGLKLLRSVCMLHCNLRSDAPHAEDAEDAFYDFLEAMKNRVREDRCLGSGGFEVGGFVVGEGGSPPLRWQMGPPETVAERTTAYLLIQFSVDYYEQG